jgi:hypothetical protein
LYLIVRSYDIYDILNFCWFNVIGCDIFNILFWFELIYTCNTQYSWIKLQYQNIYTRVKKCILFQMRIIKKIIFFYKFENNTLIYLIFKCNIYYFLIINYCFILLYIYIFMFLLFIFIVLFLEEFHSKSTVFLSILKIFILAQCYIAHSNMTSFIVYVNTIESRYVKLGYLEI